MKIVTSILTAGILLTSLSCSSSKMRQSGLDLGMSRLSTWQEPIPYGMIKVPRGAITMGTDSLDSIWGIPQQKRSISVETFLMDKNEVTNAQYREFVHYVRDSILRERLADPRYGGDDRYRITEDKYGEPIKPRLNWSIPLPKEPASEEAQRAINSLYYTNSITGERKLDARQMNYRYEVYDTRGASRMLHLLRQVERNKSWHKPIELPQITKDTAYIARDGSIVRERITRTLSGEYDFLNTYIVGIYPDEEVWTKDWPRANNDAYSRRYFLHPAYDKYPVVGVTWEQANAYCAWRTMRYKEENRIPREQSIEPFRLPTEAEFEYAARAGNNKQLYPWSSGDMLDAEDCLCGNFMPDEGNYTADKHLITAPVGSFAPNDYGLYDLGGNVAEWTSNAWSLSGIIQGDNINPEQEYSVAPSEPYTKARKVVKGGSWKDVAKYIRANSRVMEYQDKARSYIGFRCVRSVVVPQ